jgi:hypothetical protein
MKTKLQNKWRLPTVEEFENVIYPNKDKIPNLKTNSDYWSSSEDYGLYNAWYFSFGLGLAVNYFKYYTAQIRAVRDVSSDSINSTIIGNLEIYNEDLDSMSWDDAVDAVDKLNYNKKYQNENRPC